MCLETAQMYCTATGSGPYRPTHTGNKFMKWAAANLSWLIRFHQALAGEHYHRTGNMHSSFTSVGQFMPDLPVVEPKAFINAARTSKMSYDIRGVAKPMDFTHIKDVHQAYRFYMRARWVMDSRPPQWTRRKPPEWIDEPESDMPMLRWPDLIMPAENTWQVWGMNKYLSNGRLR